jgi:hypothetical protein
MPAESHGTDEFRKLSRQVDELCAKVAAHAGDYSARSVVGGECRRVKLPDMVLRKLRSRYESS